MSEFFLISDLKYKLLQTNISENKRDSIITIACLLEVLTLAAISITIIVIMQHSFFDYDKSNNQTYNNLHMLFSKLLEPSLIICFIIVIVDIVFSIVIINLIQRKKN